MEWRRKLFHLLTRLFDIRPQVRMRLGQSVIGRTEGSAPLARAFVGRSGKRVRAGHVGPSLPSWTLGWTEWGWWG